MVIGRYLKLDTDRWEKTKRDLSQLVRLIKNSGGEYSLQLRENYFNIYYQGNSLAQVTLNKNGSYTAKIHRKFAQGETLKKLERWSVNKPSQRTGSHSEYAYFNIQPQNLHRFFQRSNINSLSSKIRAVHNGEEITFEQVLITDNPPSENFIIIDRQVADRANRAQIDLLALRRDSIDEPFHFLVIEVKLGRNPELREKVGKQLSKYIDHIRKYMKDYAACYKENYRQKKELGLFDLGLPNEIEFDEDEKTVEGLVVACGYSQLAEQALGNLRQKIEVNRWDIKAQQMPKLELR
jgi:CRISPR/Cas system-associated exonuclease Cas4 (RecB family)